MFNTKCYIKYNSKYANSCYVFSFLRNFKLKAEFIIDWKSLLVTNLASHMAELLFQKLQYVSKIQFIVGTLTLNMKIKNLCNLSNQKTQLFLNYRRVGEEV